jgi:hypothetical protein
LFANVLLMVPMNRPDGCKMRANCSAVSIVRTSSKSSRFMSDKSFEEETLGLRPGHEEDQVVSSSTSLPIEYTDGLMKASTWATIVLALLLWPVAVRAQQVSVDIDAHGVTLAAKDVTLEQILAEWSRVGGVEISVRGSGFSTAPVTLFLEGIAERKALEILLRDVGGYLLVARQDPSGGSSAFRQVVIVPRRGDEPLPGVVAKEPPRPRVVRGRFARAADSLAAQPSQGAAPGPDRQQEEDFSEKGVEGSPETQGDPGLASVPPTRSPTAEASSDGDTSSTNPPPTPLLPPAATTPGPGNPFGVASGAARPGTMTPGTQPPPGVVYPVVTNPAIESQPFTPGESPR